jgi:hypothetical protein
VLQQAFVSYARQAAAGSGQHLWAACKHLLQGIPLCKWQLLLSPACLPATSPQAPASPACWLLWCLPANYLLEKHIPIVTGNCCCPPAPPSPGTFIASLLVRRHPQRVASLYLLDPVTIGM